MTRHGDTCEYLDHDGQGKHIYGNRDIVQCFAHVKFACDRINIIFFLDLLFGIRFPYDDLGREDLDPLHDRILSFLESRRIGDNIYTVEQYVGFVDIGSCLLCAYVGHREANGKFYMVTPYQKIHHILSNY